MTDHAVLQSLQCQSDVLQAQCYTFLCTLRTEAMDAIYTQHQLMSDSVDHITEKSQSIVFRIPIKIPMYEMNSMYKQDMALEWLKKEIRKKDLFCKSIERGTALWISWHPKYTEKLQRAKSLENEARLRAKEILARKEEEQWQIEQQMAYERQKENQKHKVRQVIELNGKMSPMEVRSRLTSALLKHDAEKKHDHLLGRRSMV